MSRLITILVCFRFLASSVHATDSTAVLDDGTWQQRSPDGKVFAALAVKLNDREIWRQDLGEGILEIVRGGTSFVAGPFMCFSIGDREGVKSEWSPDSRYLVITTCSLGGQSPWHFTAFAFDTSSATLRLMDDTIGLVVSSDFKFQGPHTVKMKIATMTPDGALDLEHSKQVDVDLDDRVPAMKSLLPVKTGDLRHD